MASEYGVWVYQGRVHSERSIDPQLEIMPSIGIQWVF
jgi:hypothetical protein